MATQRQLTKIGGFVMKKTVTLMFFLSLALIASAALAQTEYTYPKDAPALSVTFPEGWKVELDQEDQKGISAVSTDEGITLYMWPLDEQEVKDDPKAAIEAAAKDAGQDIAEWVTDVKFQEPKIVEFNGISFLDIEGAGKAKEDGSDATVSVTFFTPDNKTVFAMLYYGSPDADKANEKDLASIAQSIKKP
jgi:hypothetical protein